MTEKGRSRHNKTTEGNYRLKLERERRGWSLDHVATLIGCPDPHTVGRWERQIFSPSPRYRQALCELYGKNAQELGFIKQGETPENDAHSGHSPGTNAPPFFSPPCFYFNMKLPHANELYGRKIESEILLQRILHKSSTLLVGSRRIGKTWLLEYLLLEAQRRLGNLFRIGYLDAMTASCSTISGFTLKAARALGSSLSFERAKGGLVVLENVVETLRSKGLSLVLCIDEFEYMYTRPEFDLNFFAGLRALAQEGLNLVVTSRRPLGDIISERGDDGGFFTIFEQITLKSFGSKDAEAFVMAKTPCTYFTDRERAMLLHYSRLADEGWPPIRLQLAAKLLFEEKILKGNVNTECSSFDDTAYWEHFSLCLEEKYQAVKGHSTGKLGAELS